MVTPWGFIYGISLNYTVHILINTQTGALGGLEGMESYLLPSIPALRTLIVDVRAGYLYPRGGASYRAAALQNENARRFELETNANRLQNRFFYCFERNFVAIRFLYAKKR